MANTSGILLDNTVGCLLHKVETCEVLYGQFDSLRYLFLAPKSRQAISTDPMICLDFGKHGGRYPLD